MIIRHSETYIGYMTKRTKHAHTKTTLHTRKQYPMHRVRTRENRRVNGMPKQKTILNLSQNCNIPENPGPGLNKRGTAALRNQDDRPKMPT